VGAVEAGGGPGSALIAQRTRGELTAVAVAVLAMLVLLILTILAHRWWTGEGGSYAPPRAIVDANVSPARSLFGEVLTARARIVVDPERFDARRIRVMTNFKPYRVRGESHDISGGPGRSVVVDFAYELQCTSRECLPRGGGRAAAAEVVQLPAGTATLPRRGGGSVRRALVWPAVAVQSRLTSDEIGLSTPKAMATAAPAAVTWGRQPDRLAALSLGAAMLLTLAAAWLIATVARRDLRLVRTPRIPAHLTPIDRALVLAQHAATHGEVDESRKALQRLAIELRRQQEESQAKAAERLAWSAPGPSRATVDELARSVRSNGAR
jgi:hypothetical protein